MAFLLSSTTCVVTSIGEGSVRFNSLRGSLKVKSERSCAIAELVNRAAANHFSSMAVWTMIGKGWSALTSLTVANPLSVFLVD